MVTVPLYNISINFRVDTDEQAKDVRSFMERMLCDFLKDRPATCIRVSVNEVDSDGNVVREVIPQQQTISP
mgnify:CR=1 FL=1